MKDFTLVSTLVAAIAICAAPVVAEVPDAVELLPDSTADALLVGSLDVRQLADLGELDMADKLIPLLMLQFEEPELFDELQFDITKDLHSMAFAAAIDFERGGDPQMIFAATGAFKGQAILEAITKRAKIELADVNGVNVLPLDDDGMFAILDDTAAVLGTEQWVRDAIERFAGENRGESKAAERLKHHPGVFALQINSAALPEDVWKAAQMIGIGQQNVVSAGIAGNLVPIKALNLEMEAKVAFNEPETAQNVRNGIAEMLDEVHREAPVAQLFFNQVEFARDENVLTARFDTVFNPLSYMIPIAGLYLAQAEHVEMDVHVAPIQIEEQAGLELPEEAVVLGDPQEQAACENNLQRIAIALHVHVNEQEDKAFPANLKEMVDNEVLLDMNLLVCPADRTAFTPGEWYTSYETLFELTEKRIPQDSIPADTIIIWDKQMRHGGGRNVLLADGSVKFVPEHRFQASLQRAKRAVGE